MRALASANANHSMYSHCGSGRDVQISRACSSVVMKKSRMVVDQLSPSPNPGDEEFGGEEFGVSVCSADEFKDGCLMNNSEARLSALLLFYLSLSLSPTSYLHAITCGQDDCLLAYT